MKQLSSNSRQHMIKYQNVWIRQEMLQEFRKGSDNLVALLFSAYKLANCSIICMKCFTLVFLAALGLDSQAGLRAYENICTPVSIELVLFCCCCCCVLFLIGRGSASTSQSAHDWQVVFDSHNFFQLQNKKSASSFPVFQSSGTCPLPCELPLTWRGGFI